MAADYVTQPIASAVSLNEPPKIVDSGMNLQGIISQAGSYESNPLLQISGAKPLYGSTTSPELIFKDSTPTTQINADTLVNGNAFNQSTFNSVDFHSAAGIENQSDRWETGLIEHTDYDTTRTSELTNFGLSDRPFRHTSFQLAPEASYSPSSIDKISVLGGYSTTSYGSDVYSNFDVYSVTPTYVHNFDPRNAGVFALQAQRYETTTNLKGTNDTIGPSIGWIMALTPDLTAKATGGVQTSRQSGQGTTNDSWQLQYIFSADVSYTGLRDTVSFLAARSEYPLGDGLEGLLTNFSLSDVHKLSDNLNLNLGAGYQTTTYQSNTTGSLQAQYFANGGLTYAFSDRVDLTGSYQYRYETLSGITGTAQDHLVSLALIYRLQAGSL